jgi:hypothetical protein
VTTFVPPDVVSQLAAVPPTACAYCLPGLPCILHPVAEFERCASCGAEAALHVSWDPAMGWCCSRCMATDGDE